MPLSPDQLVAACEALADLLKLRQMLTDPNQTLFADHAMAKLNLLIWGA